MKTTIKIMIALCLLSGLYFWVSIYAEWQKVIIDAATKKIIIQSWDQNLDLAALKAASENMLFYDGKAYKLKDVTFAIPRDAKRNFKFMDKC